MKIKVLKASKRIILNNKNKGNNMGRYNKRNDSTKEKKKASNERKLNTWSPAKYSITSPEQFLNEQAQQRRMSEEKQYVEC